jgi:DNA (cytosine-5)-methyltransferase 1
MTIGFGLDFEHYAAETFRKNFASADFLQKDIREVPAHEVAARISGTAPLLIAACAPCQPYSSFVRSSKAARADRSLLLRLIPILELAGPDLILIENVPGLDTKAPAGTFARFCKALRRLGFWLDWRVVDCREYGIPQRRRRLLLLGSRFGPIQLPPATHGKPDLRPFSTVRDWIADLPPISAGETHPAIPNHTASALTEINLRRLKASRVGSDRFEWPSGLWLKCHADHRGHSDVYGRMSWDEPSPALTTKCTSISNGRFGHPEQDRPISVREAASIQTFPRDFVFVGGIKNATRQVGNAVPVLLAQRMGEHIGRHVREVRSGTTSSAPTGRPYLASPLSVHDRGAT